MNKAARMMIQRIRSHGYRVLFMCNFDASVSVTAIGPSGDAHIVQGKLCDDSRLVEELGRMVGISHVVPAENVAHRH